MADVKKNKFTYDRNYYENMSKHVSGTAAKALDALEYEEDFFEDGEIFDEEYSEYDFETSPKKKEPVRPAIQVTPGRHKKEKVKVRYKFNIVTLMMIVVSIVALVAAIGKKYGRAWNLIVSILIAAIAVLILIAPILFENRQFVDYFLNDIIGGQQYFLLVGAGAGVLQLLFSLFFLASLKKKVK